MANDTIIMSACIIAILTLNTLIFFYNQAPIEQAQFNFTETSVNQFNTDLNETGLGETSTGFKTVINILKFFLNIFILLIGWYPNFPTSVNLIIKLGVYMFAIPLFIIIIRMIRGVG